MNSIFLHPSPIRYLSPSYDVVPFRTHDPLAESNSNAGRRLIRLERSKVGHSEGPSTSTECRVSLGTIGGLSLTSGAKSTEGTGTKHGSDSSS